MSIRQIISVQQVAKVTMVEKIRCTRNRRESKDSFSGFLKQPAKQLNVSKKGDSSDVKNPFLDKLGTA